MKTCIVCSVEFRPVVNWQEYCSPRCRRAHHAHGFGASEAQFREAVASGLSAPQIADRFVISAASVRVRAKYLGLVIAKASRKPEWHAKAISLHAEGLLNHEIAARCGVSRGAVTTCFANAGIKSNRKVALAEPKHKVKQFRASVEKFNPRYGAIIFNGPIVERVYRVIDGATIQTKRRGGSTAIGGTIVLETTDPLKAFRMVAEKAGRVKTDSKNKVLAYSIKKAPRNHS